MSAASAGWQPVLPLDLVEGNDNHGPYITTDFGTTVCDFYCMSDPSSWAVCNGGTSKPVWFTEAAEYAAFMVKAANAHDELLCGLRDMLAATDPWRDVRDTDGELDARQRAVALLAKHGGGQ
ncbi:hypothetical protein HFN71_28460 [Rhizobium laguerreae]|uniref:hypothetical protein n=1 Tax=Rhizobium laguerreae TaxID=1076926 RepID=UPI001C928858|nr:hypothetical protein [Rhizobium laguerreae]MBY3543620.1 hypothetical protein [Rhizobium laguerreae]